MQYDLVLAVQLVNLLGWMVKEEYTTSDRDRQIVKPKSKSPIPCLTGPKGDFFTLSIFCWSTPSWLKVGGGGWPVPRDYCVSPSPNNFGFFKTLIVRKGIKDLDLGLTICLSDEVSLSLSSLSTKT